MQGLADKYFKVVVALFVVFAAILSARLASQLVAKALWAPRAADVAIQTQRPRPVSAERLSQYRVIQERNLFNDNPAPVSLAAKTQTEAMGSLPTAPMQKLELILVATGLVGDGVSFALFKEEGELELVHVGEEVRSGAVLSEVRTDRVFVTYLGQRTEHLLFVERASNTAAEERRSSRRKPRTRNTKKATASSDTIRKIDDTSWVIDRREVDQAMANLSQLITQIRVVPNMRDGQADGFKVFSIRPNSLFAKIGIRNGDVIKEVNGLQLNGVDQAYQALTKLQGASSISTNIMRGNSPVTLSYEIR
jgi:general secretion pathway protein C